MRLVNLGIAFGVLMMFGNMLGLVALFGKLGYDAGWWGDGPVVSAAVAVAVAGTGAAVNWIVRLTR